MDVEECCISPGQIGSHLDQGFVTEHHKGWNPGRIGEFLAQTAQLFKELFVVGQVGHISGVFLFGGDRFGPWLGHGKLLLAPQQRSRCLGEFENREVGHILEQITVVHQVMEKA